MSVQEYNLTKCLKKKLDGNYVRMLYVVLNKCWEQYPTKQQLYDHLPLISQTIQVRWTKHSGEQIHKWHSKKTPTYEHTSVGHPAKIYSTLWGHWMQSKELPRILDDWDGWQEGDRELCAVDALWWWWY